MAAAGSGKPADIVLRRKVAFLGASFTGKTSIRRSVFDGQFQEAYEPTVQHSDTRQLKIDGKQFLITIIDTAGQDDVPRIPDDARLGVAGYVIVYDVTSRPTFSQVGPIHDALVQVAGEGVAVLIVANKVDLRQSGNCIATEEGEALARRLGCGFLEASARTATNVDEVIEHVIKFAERKSGIFDEPASAPASAAAPSGTGWKCAIQ